MRKIAFVLMALFLCVPCFAATVNLGTVTVPDEIVSELQSAIDWKEPKPNGVTWNAYFVTLFRKYGKLWMVRTLNDYREKVARDSVIISPDNTFNGD